MPEAPRIVIVGAGPVGLALALGLARRGLSTVVLEKKEALSEHSKAVLVTVRTMEILHEWGIAATFREQGEWVDDIHVHDSVAGRGLFALSFTTLRPISPTPGVCVMPQDQTERLLFEACQETGLVEVRFGSSLAAFDADESGVRARIQGAGQQEVIECDYLCGCDGAHSSVREGLGMKLEGKTYDAHAVLADVLIEDQRDALPWPRVDSGQPNLSAAIRFRPGYWRIIFAEGGGTELEPVDPLFVQQKVAQLIGPGPAEIVWSSAFNIHCRNARHFRSGRVLLLGDAAHLNSPAGGQGMNAGIQDAHNLAWKIDRIARGADAELLLNSYDAERFDAITRNVDIATDRLTRFGILGPTWLRSFGIGVLGWLMNFAGIRRRVACAMGMLKLRYDEGDLIDRSGGRYLPDIELGDGFRLRSAMGTEGGIVEVVQNGAKVTFGETTYDLSTSAGEEINRAGGPFLAVRPDHVIAYSGGSRQRAEAVLALLGPAA